MKKINKRKIFIVISVILISVTLFSFLGNNVMAQINPDTDKNAQDAAETFNDIIKSLTNISSNSVFASLARLVGILAMNIYLSLATIFTGATGSIFPTPDNIIFNRISILDINFFNPNKNSIIGLTGDLIPNLYNTFHTVALTAFVLCAMVVGIKIVLSSLASEKASAKNALKNWIVGIVLLILMRLLIAGIFELNELIVYNLSGIVTESAEFTFDLLEPIKTSSLIGVPLYNIVRGTLDFISGGEGESIGEVIGYGYNGLLAKYAWQAAASGDLLSSILLFVIIGQTVTLFIAYAKRLMYIIILGVLAPMVVLLDTVNKIIKGNSTILNSWFKEFVTDVFMQTFHAILMVVTMMMLSKVAEYDNQFFAGMAAIVLTAGMIKFEKIYKKVFGMQDGMVGGLQGQAAKLLVGLNAAKTGIKAVADNGAKLKNAYKQRNEANMKKTELTHQRGRQNAYASIENASLAAQASSDPVKQQEYITKTLELAEKAKRDGYDLPPDFMKNLENITKQLQSGGTLTPALTASQTNGVTSRFNAQANDRYSQLINNNSVGGNTTNSNIYNNSNTSNSNKTSNSTVGSTGTNREVIESNKNIEREISKLRKQLSSVDKSSSITKLDKEISKADREIKSANKEIMSAGLATAMGPANLIAGFGMGLGAGDSLTDSLKGGYVTAALDSAAEHAGRAIGAAVNQRFDAHSKTDDTY